MEQLTKNDIKWIRSLHQKKERNEQGLFLVEGEKLVLETLEQKHFEIQMVVGTIDFIETISTSAIIKSCSKSDLERISTLKTPNKALAIVEQKTAKQHFEGPILVLDGVQDPGNMGTILRLADWFGYSEIICSEDTVEHTNPKVIQSSMGSFFRIPVRYMNLPNFFNTFDGEVFGALLEGEDYRTIQSDRKLALLMGNEGKGIRPETQQFITKAVTIPRVGEAESLNVATATAILMAQFH